MAKQIEMMSAEAKAAKVAKLLEARAERLRTKKFPRPEKFAAEMKDSEYSYTNRVEDEARLKYVKQILKAAGLAVDETTANYRECWNGNAVRTGVYIQAGMRNVLAKILVHGTTDEGAYIAAMVAYGHKVEVTAAPATMRDDCGFGRICIMVEM